MDAFCAEFFDEWVRRDVGRVFIQMYDTALGAWMGQDPSLCIFARTCGKALIIEHNGDLYSCDHFVYPDYRLGNVHDMAIRDMVDSPLQKFGNDKEDTLPQLASSATIALPVMEAVPNSVLRALHRRERPELSVQGLQDVLLPCRSLYALYGQ